MDAMKFIYEDKFRGLALGIMGSVYIKDFFDKMNRESKGKYGPDTLYILSGVPIVGTVYEFVYGVGHSSYALRIQVKEDFFIDYEEKVLYYAKLQYDAQNRLS